MRRGRLTVEAYAEGVLGGDRAVLARAITLVESTRDDDRRLAQEVLQRVLPRTGGSERVGITGTPGVGKSTLIEALGLSLVESGKRLAVLAVDPSSGLSGGSILGDKTRMERLSREPAAFIRPSPAGRSLGGVARRTREVLLLCEAAGFDVVLVETVGVGQSETAIEDLVDCFVALLLPGGGDELQGIKRGIMELADLLVINKADGDGMPRARLAKREYAAALRYLRPKSSWRPRVLTVSGKTGAGLDDLWATVAEHRAALLASGELETRRRRQRRRWLWSAVDDELGAAFRRHPGVAAALPAVEAEVEAGAIPPVLGAMRLLEAFRG